MGLEGHCAGEGAQQGGVGQGGERVPLYKEQQHLLQGDKQEALVSNFKKFSVKILQAQSKLVF